MAPPGGADPATIAIRVFQGNQLLADSAVVFPGPGGFGTYRIPVHGPRDTRLPPNSQVRIALFENGVEVASTTATVPPNTGSVVSIVAADLVGQDPPPPAGRVLRGTISQLLTYGPGSAPSPTSVPLAGARVPSARARAA